MTDRERWEEIGCGDGACVFRTPTGMHTNGGCKCVPRKADYNAVERWRLRQRIMVMRDRIAAQERELAEARDELAVFRRNLLLLERIVTEQEDITGNEPESICPIAEAWWRQRSEARRRVEELEGRQEVLLNIARFTDDYLNGRSEAMKPWELREAVRHVLKTMTAEDPTHD